MVRRVAHGRPWAVIAHRAAAGRALQDAFGFGHAHLFRQPLGKFGRTGWNVPGDPVHERRDRPGVRILGDDQVGACPRGRRPSQRHRHAVGVLAIALVQGTIGGDRWRRDLQLPVRSGLRARQRQRHPAAPAVLFLHAASRRGLPGRAGDGTFACIRNPVDHAVRVVPEQQRSILGLRQADRTSDMGLSAIRQEAGQERLECNRSASLEFHPDQFVARGRTPVPGAAEGNEGVAAVWRGKHRSRVEQHLHRRSMRGIA